MKSIFNKTDYEEIVARANKLTAEIKPLWGTMNAAQMMAHCAIAAGMSTGIEKIKDGSNFLKRFFFKNLVVGKKPFKKGLPTGKELLMTDQKEFENEKQRFLIALEAAHKNGVNGKWEAHSLVGELTGEEWGWLIYKHSNHHLEQFGV
ncbi:MAG: DUF1569 domain-containing protein [Bacteroidia bacterium]|nr:DUF1569 domain-containing protein [Bacteroidia bacterium]